MASSARPSPRESEVAYHSIFPANCGQYWLTLPRRRTIYRAPVEYSRPTSAVYPLKYAAVYPKMKHSRAIRGLKKHTYYNPLVLLSAVAEISERIKPHKAERGHELEPALTGEESRAPIAPKAESICDAVRAPCSPACPTVKWSILPCGPNSKWSTTQAPHPSAFAGVEGYCKHKLAPAECKAHTGAPKCTMCDRDYEAQFTSSDGAMACMHCFQSHFGACARCFDMRSLYWSAQYQMHLCVDCGMKYSV